MISHSGSKLLLLLHKVPVLFGGSIDNTVPLYSSGEIGDVNTVTLEITFDEPVKSADFTAGVTIKVNTVSQVITSGTLQVNLRTVYYVIPAADINDVVTWEYSAAGGSISDLAGNLLANVAAQTAINYIGSQFYFNDFNASGHLVSLGV